MPCIVLWGETRIITIINLRKTTRLHLAIYSHGYIVPTWPRVLRWIAGKLFRRSRLANRITRKEREWRRADLATGSFAAGCLESPRSAAIFTWIESHGWLTPVVVFFHRVQAYREPIINCRMPLSSPWDKYMDEDGRQEVDHSFSRIERKTSQHDTLSRIYRYSWLILDLWF